MDFFVSELGTWLMSFSLSIVRILVILTFVPLFGFKQVKAKAIKVAVCIGIAMPIFADINEQLYNQNIAFSFLSLIVFKEAALGTVIGFILAIPFWIFQATGALIDNQRGALSAGYMNPASGPDASMLGDLFSKLVVVVMLYAGIFPHMFTFIYLSHELWPVFEKMPEFQNMAWAEMIHLFNRMVKQFVLYAGPVVLILLMVEGAFAFLGAYSPQLQVYFMAMPAKSLSALVIVVLYFSYLTQNMEAEASYYFDLESVYQNIFKVSDERFSR